MFHSIEEAVSDLQAGKIVIVVDDEDRENEGDFVALSEHITPETINFMITYGKGLVCTSITEELANKLELPLMTTNNTDPYNTAFTVTIDHSDTTTGISAYERALTIKEMTKGTVRGKDFKRPGHVFPLISKNGGVLERPGHTEASVDLAILSETSPSSVICEIIREDGKMARMPDLQEIAEKFNMKIITIKDLINYQTQKESKVTREVETSLPTKYGLFNVYGYTTNVDDKEHIALVKGEIEPSDVPLVRIHSECLTGDVFGSHRCDCGPQLDLALKSISEAGKGVLIYMRQEGRGIGLLNKLRAYQLQDEGLDTVEANNRLGFRDDLREYGTSAQILFDLGINRVKLLTNNPRKVTGLTSNNIQVEQRIPIETATRNENVEYMKTKSKKLGHILSME